MNKRTRKVLDEYAKEHRAEWVADDKREQNLVLSRMSEGAHLYVADQPDGPTGDVRYWTANLATSRDANGHQIMGRDLQALRDQGLILYDRSTDKFVLTDRGREAANRLSKA